MARTIAQIFDSIQTARAADPVLAGLTSTSATALHRLVAYVVATTIWAHEMLFDRFRAEVDAIVASAPIGTAPWFCERVKEWQPGDPLAVLASGRPGYALVDPTRRLITQAAAKEDSTGRLVLKVAKGTTDALASLTVEELREAFAYADRIRPAGIRLSLASREADRLRLAGAVYFDPLLNPADVWPLIQEALTAALRALPFDGVLYVQKLVDAIQAVAGVVDVELTASVRLGSDPPAPVARAWESPAGYLVEEDAVGATWQDTLLLVPNA